MGYTSLLFTYFTYLPSWKSLQRSLKLLAGFKGEGALRRGGEKRVEKVKEAEG